MLEIARDGLYRMRYADMRTWSTTQPGSRSPARRPRAAGHRRRRGRDRGRVRGDAEVGEPPPTRPRHSSTPCPTKSSRRHLEFAGNALAGAEMLLDRYESGLRHAERTFAVAEATGQGQRLPVLFWTGTVRTMVGRLRDAAEVLDTAIEIARVAGHEQGMMWNLFARSFAALAAGDNATALDRRARGEPGDADRRAQLPRDRRGPRARRRPARPRRRGRRPRRPLRDLRGGAAQRPRGLARERVRAARPHRARARPPGAAAGRAARRRKRWRSGSARAPWRRWPTAPPRTWRCRRTAPLTGPAHAAQLALRSAAAFADAGAPVEAAVSRALAGRALAAAGETERAVAELERAAGDFERYDALGHRDACERELRRLGRRGRYRRTKAVGDGSPVGSLTERELQIARLVVDRRTNAEIAAELYLSTKTVETHLRNLFHKLGVSSRVEVARVVERADAANPTDRAAS